MFVSTCDSALAGRATSIPLPQAICLLPVGLYSGCFLQIAHPLRDWGGFPLVMSPMNSTKLWPEWHWVDREKDFCLGSETQNKRLSIFLSNLIWKHACGYKWLRNQCWFPQVDGFTDPKSASHQDWAIHACRHSQRWHVCAHTDAFWGKCTYRERLA